MHPTVPHEPRTIMQRTARILIVLTLLTGASTAQSDTMAPAPVFGRYRPAADPHRQLKEAVAEAAGSRRILLEVGGEWCIWCHRLDTLFLRNPDLTGYLKRHFVLVKINVSPENENKEFLKAYPKVPGYPHLFVLENDGRFLHSQDTGELEKGKGHDREKVMEFLRRWTLPRKE
ncbi:MAG: thioredoxin family protein [Bacteroidetes bacterium]|nr:MAG: thioredoxin family protein [Bacteroidota bacterium]